ncbi:4-(cytidine 5'-diphospho)-2-C-methyl-D-erythritol kinase [Estrella lausannensis]|uniref:4-diphosphocytidyl-2-C-methyl-D-erythritol kinase n=1 Tax=Estrella lausannensis TaxID=483423 RepID=A0A0H5DPD2_9BACT|nr:4-(cytidine 5'-diphospho)-2-C-methyl-D-erythritol kinase [Estrella lausannensis]CRX38401.1 4-diphosphocytidyl-2-C-methyl-D-erythritolkinase [Estrella lausannensis]
MITLASPAKVNLFLRVLGKRTDGYHELVSLFQTISLKDIITIEKAEQDQLSCSDPSVPTDQTNTVAKALAAFRKRSHDSTSFRIHLTKQIPHGAGLGGGSSNAATVLFGVNALSSAPLSGQDLLQAALEVGSDVPFFLSTGTALCKGRGEIIEEMTPLNEEPLHIVMPSFTLSTPRVYNLFQAAKCRERSYPQKGSDIEAENYPCFNDLEGPAFEIAPLLRDYKSFFLSQGYDRVFMTGSGSALVVMGSKEPLLPPGCRHFPARFISRAPATWYHTESAS